MGDEEDQRMLSLSSSRAAEVYTGLAIPEPGFFAVCETLRLVVSDN
jgi:hypothetical protein